jgi:diguanylate cyclase (GGDEF)-like protein/PAS domain S-box-containing protein
LINDTELKWLGYERDELLGESITKILPPDERDIFARNFEVTQELGSRDGFEIEVQRKDGTRFPASLNVSLIRDANGEFLSTRSTMFDISAAKAATAALRASEARFQAFMDNGPIVATIKDANGCYLYANRQMLQRFNKSYEEFVGHCDFELWPSETYQQVREHDQMVLAGDKAVVLEQTVQMPGDKSTCWLSFKFPLPDASGRKLLGALAIDITDRKYYEQQLQEYQLQLEEAVQRLEEIAITDSLTGVRNHGAFIARLEEEVARAHRYQTPLALLMLDADNFKQYNDTFGHPAGDGALKQIAQCLTACARPSDFVARYGGEEFAVILSNTDAEGAQAFAERMRRAIEDAPWPHRVLTISVGVAALDEKIGDCVKLLAAADQALYVAKRAGKNRVSLAD